MTTTTTTLYLIDCIEGNCDCTNSDAAEWIRKNLPKSDYFYYWRENPSLDEAYFVSGDLCYGICDEAVIIAAEPLKKVQAMFGDALITHPIDEHTAQEMMRKSGSMLEPRPDDGIDWEAFDYAMGKDD